MEEGDVIVRLLTGHPDSLRGTLGTSTEQLTSGVTACSHGNVSLRVGGILHHIGVGRHLHAPIIMLINDLDVRLIHATTGEIIRTLTIDPTRCYHGTGARLAAPDDATAHEKRQRAEPDAGSAVSDVPRHHISALGESRTPNLLIRSQMLYPLSYERSSVLCIRTR